MTPVALRERSETTPHVDVPFGRLGKDESLLALTVEEALQELSRTPEDIKREQLQSLLHEPQYVRYVDPLTVAKHIVYAFGEPQ